MRRKTLWIEPRGGLCNRMRTVESAVHFARDKGMALRMVWRVEETFGSRFDTLFEPIAEIERITYQSRYHASPRDRIWLANRLGLWPWRPVLAEKEVSRIMKDQEDMCAYVGRRGLYLRTWSRFYHKPVTAGLFRPLPALRERVAQDGAATRNAIGVHIRHGDHKAATEYSPTDLFVQRVATEFEKDPDARVFLATDDPEAEEIFRAEFGERVTTRDKTSLDRAKPEAIDDAMIDLYCLAQTRLILGSTASSFSRTAAELGGIPLEIVTRWKDEPLVW